MIDAKVAMTVVLMAAATYLTRCLGYLVMRDREFGPGARAVFDAAPGCVLLAVIAPAFASPRPANLLALGITALAALRLPLLPTVVIGVSAAGLLRHALA
ncbi:AzlD family protein [Bradyrhizobium sp. SBR1B]|uniref:AzlD family protein n=1 Tax=Bradyrhizobium sp. SBR1B TaxID=2663836 RepID=UPI001606DFAE|nr:AzlD domain-containing protein [Bradyrhizobium sp. SBR1B]MBB4381944.1 putative membrane protein [Bradyrhizobium sp. SBR1B]